MKILSTVYMRPGLIHLRGIVFISKCKRECFQGCVPIEIKLPNYVVGWRSVVLFHFYYIYLFCVTEYRENLKR